MSNKRLYPSGAEKRSRTENKRKAALIHVCPLSAYGFGSKGKGQVEDESEDEFDGNHDNANAIHINENNCSEHKDAEPVLRSYDNDTYHIDLQSDSYAETSHGDNASYANATPEEILYSPDPADWIVSEGLIKFFVVKGHLPQNSDINPETIQLTGQLFGDKMRFLPMSIFKRKMINGETVNRLWLVFSPKTLDVYCGVCKLFSESQDQFSTGYKDWKNVTTRILSHESSKDHKNALLAWSHTLRRQDIDIKWDEEVTQELSYWKTLLERIVKVIVFLAERGLPFRGKDECIGSEQNGNYLGIIELLSEYDCFLAKHIEKYKCVGRGKVSYLSSTICDEFIEVIGKTVLDKIVRKILYSKYFGIIVDSTPDLQHVDQLTFIIRHVNPLTFQVDERFLQFIPITSHKGEDLTSTILQFLAECGLSVANIRSQSYDNAANMSGQYMGVQSRIKAVNPLAEYVPCSAHSLNLVGNTAASCCTNAISFFGIVQKLYNFLSSSTHRWKVFNQTLRSETEAAEASHTTVKLLVAKTLCETRWSARHDAVKALKVNYVGVINTLIALRNDEKQNKDTHSEADNLIKKLSQAENVLLCHLWCDILERTNKVNNVLQTSGLLLTAVVDNMASLIEYINIIREEFNQYEEKALHTVNAISINSPQSVQSPSNHNDSEIAPEIKELSYRGLLKRSVKRKKPFPEGAASGDKTTVTEHSFSPQDEFKIQTFLPICDSLLTELNKRIAVYRLLNNDFSFLFEYKTTFKQKSKAAMNLVNKYPMDLEPDFVNEIVHFHAHVKTSLQRKLQPATGNETDVQSQLHNVTATDIVHFMTEATAAQCFPNVAIALRIYLCIPCSVAEGERSFSKLSRIKSEKRSTMGQERLNALSLLSIEHELAREVDFGEVIEQFSNSKARKVII